MKNNKGFTLAEVMGVLAILSILILLIVPNLVNNLKQAKTDLYENQISNIKMALQNWKLANPSLLPNDSEGIYLTIGQLKKDNYLDNDLKNPLDETMWPNDMLVSIVNNNGYQYNVLKDSGTKTDTYTISTPYLSFDLGDVIILNVGDVFTYPVVTLNKSDGTKQIVTDIIPTITGGEEVSTVKPAAYQLQYKTVIDNIPISSIFNIIVRNNEFSNQYTPEYIPDATYYENGTSIYFNPVTGQKCNALDSLIQTNNSQGCMKWYTFLDEVGNTDINLLLANNIIALTPFIDTTNINNVLVNNISSWKDYVKVTTRLITASEIAKITKADQAISWKVDKPTITPPIKDESISYFYFDGAYSQDLSWQTSVANQDNLSKYAWLYDYTACSSYGCQYADIASYPVDDTTSPTCGYWTSSPVFGVDKEVWAVDCYGKLDKYEVTDNKNLGIRPVITIPKSLIK